MIAIVQQKDIRKIISNLNKLVGEKLAALDELDYEADHSQIFFDIFKPEVSEPTRNQKLANWYNELNKISNEIHTIGIILGNHFNKPESDYSATLTEVNEFAVSVIKRLDKITGELKSFVN